MLHKWPINHPIDELFIKTKNIYCRLVLIAVFSTPYFEVRGLMPGAGYNVFLVAHNSKGRSNATILHVYTLKDPEKQTGM